MVEQLPCAGCAQYLAIAIGTNFSLELVHCVYRCIRFCNVNKVRLRILHLCSSYLLCCITVNQYINQDHPSTPSSVACHQSISLMSFQMMTCRQVHGELCKVVMCSTIIRCLEDSLSSYLLFRSSSAHAAVAFAVATAGSSNPRDLPTTVQSGHIRAKL